MTNDNKNKVFIVDEIFEAQIEMASLPEPLRTDCIKLNAYVNSFRKTELKEIHVRH